MKKGQSESFNFTLLSPFTLVFSLLDKLLRKHILKIYPLKYSII